ncbi:MAG TPA: glycosyltransferase family 4 protein [Candidatus Limnocylindrales bacterium]|nr:glycosyltransferase family 4 protein [Candidatus Limnocylindrales bacterium]
MTGDLTPTAAAPTGSSPGERPPIAYVMSRWPKLTETFILYEVLAVEALGQRVELFPLLRHREPVSHPEALELAARAHYQPFLSRAILASQWDAIRRRPRAYFGALGALIRGTLGSANYLIGGLAIFPKVVHMARGMEAAGIGHVHCHFSNHPAAAGFIIHRLTGIPYSFVAHGSDLHVDRHMLDRKVAEAAFVVAISRDNLEEIVGEVGEHARSRVEVIHCGVDTARLRPRTEPVPADRPFTILCIGTLHEVKGQSILVEACRLLRDRGVDVRCRLIGDGADEARLRDGIAAAGLEGTVSLGGRRTREEVIAAIGDADMLAAPSVAAKDGKREGIPVVLMEAMSCGLPVVASRLSGIPELVEHEVEGLLVPPGDPTALADAIERLQADPGLRARLGASARRRIEREFDLATNARAVLDRIATSGAARATAADTAARDTPADGRLTAEPMTGQRR